MSSHRFLLGSLLALVCLGAARAAPPDSPLRLVPEQADLVLQVHEPRRILDVLTTLELAQQLQGLEAVKEAMDSTQSRRFYQLLAHFEKQLKLDRKELLDKLAGGGAVLATRYGNKAPALFVLQGKDAGLTEQFLRLGLDIIEQELARQEVKAKATRESYHGIDTFSLGNDFHTARVEGALLISNKREVLRAGLDRALGRQKNSLADHSGLKESAKLLPPRPLASLWLNMEPVKKDPGFEAFYKTPRDPFVTVTLGGWANLLGRTPWLVGSFHGDSEELFLTFRLPRGTEGMGADGAIVAPPRGEPGSRPLLRPRGTLYSTSTYYDMSRFWTDRAELFGPERARELEEFDRNSGLFLSSVGFSKLLTATGPYLRVVAAQQPQSVYTRKPRTPVPAFALVLELRKPEEFRKGMETILRAGGLAASTQFGLKMIEEKVHGCDLIGYRFDEKKTLPDDPEDFRYNFSPCFLLVGNQYVVSSTLDLARELAGLLKEEDRANSQGSPLNSRTVLLASGGKDLLKSYEDQLVASTILGQALPLPEARAQVKAVLGLFDRVEGLSMEETYAPRQFHLDLKLKFKK